MSPFPPLAALFLSHFHDLKGQEITYYASLSDDALPSQLIEHSSLPSGMHLRDEDLVTFTHHGLPGAGLFRSRVQDAGRGRRMGTLGAVLAPPAAPDAVFDLAVPLEDLYDRLEGIEDPFSAGSDGEAVAALLNTVWETYKASSLEGVAAQSATTVALRLSKGVTPANPVTYFPALLEILGPAIVTVYKASLSGQRVLLYSVPPLLPLEAFAWCIWAMGLPPSSAAAAGARASTWLGNIGLMDLDNVKARVGGWVATTTDVVYKSHTDAYDMFIDFSASMPSEDYDIRAPRKGVPAPLILGCTPSAKGKPTTSTVTYAFGDMALYRSLLLLDSSPPGVHAETVGFSYTSRSGGVWLIIFEMLERMWSLCVGVCEFALGRGRVGDIALGEDDDDARRLLTTDVAELAGTNGEYDDEEQSSDDDSSLPDGMARRGRLILDQLHHNAYHLYARLLAVAAGQWELSDADLRELTGTSRLSPWGGRKSAESQFWLALARTWNIEPVAEGAE